MMNPVLYSKPAAEHLITSMRAAKRDELIHFAGAAHRDLHAAAICDLYLCHPDWTEQQMRDYIARNHW